MSTSLSLNNFAPVTIQLTPTAQAAANFSIGLVLTQAGAVPAGGRVQSFSSAADVKAAFASDTNLGYFADAYFGQDVHPTTLKVGVQATTTSPDADATAALTACQNADSDFYGVALVPGATAADSKLAGAWALANGKAYFGVSQESDVLSPASTPTNLLYYFQNLNNGRVTMIYSDAASDAHGAAHAAVMAGYLSTDYTQANGVKVLAFKTLAGFGGATVTQSQFEKICGKPDGTSTDSWNGNVQAKFGSLTYYQRGMMANGRFVDEVMALDWFANAIQVAAINVMRTTPYKIPATDAGSQMFANAFKAVCEQAVANGLAAPGTWTVPGTAVGNVKTGDAMPAGYYIYVASVSSMSAADRQARKCPPITILLCGAGALQYCAPTVIFQR